MAARLAYLLMAVGAILIGAGSVGVASLLHVLGVALMVFGAIGAAVVTDPASRPEPAREAIRARN